MPDPTALAAQDAAEALIALDWPVKPSEDFEAWQIGDMVMTDRELLDFALRQGVHVVGGVQ